MQLLNSIPADAMPPYIAITPRADGDDIATNGERLMYRHEFPNQGGKPRFFIAEKGTVYAGWVVGIVKN